MDAQADGRVGKPTHGLSWLLHCEQNTSHRACARCQVQAVHPVKVQIWCEGPEVSLWSLRGWNPEGQGANHLRLQPLTPPFTRLSDPGCQVPQGGASR